MSESLHDELVAEGVENAADVRPLAYLQLGVLFRRAAEPDYQLLLAPRGSLVYDPAAAPSDAARRAVVALERAREREELADLERAARDGGLE